MLGGRKLWESKDERKWGHDKFEELTVQERRYEEVNVSYMCKQMCVCVCVMHFFV